MEKMQKVLDAWESLIPGAYREGELEAFVRSGKMGTAFDLKLSEAARSDEEIPAEWPEGLRSLVLEKREKIRFAQEVRDRLIDDRDLSEKATNALMRAAGPGAAERALEWAMDLREEGHMQDALELVLRRAPFGVDRHLAALADLKVPTPPISGRRIGIGVSARDFGRLCAGVLALQHYTLPSRD